MRTYVLKLLAVDLPDMIESAEDELRIARATDLPHERLLGLSCAFDYLATAKQLVGKIEKFVR